MLLLAPKHFQCLGEARLCPENAEYHRHGPMRSGVVNRLFCKPSSACSSMFESATVELLGSQFVQYALDEEMQTLFYMLRDYVNRLDDVGACIDSAAACLLTVVNNTI